MQAGAGDAAVTAVVDVVPRSREVGQSYITSVATTLRALGAASGIVRRRRPDLVWRAPSLRLLAVCESLN